MRFLKPETFSSKLDNDSQKGNRNDKPEPYRCGRLQKLKNLFRPDIGNAPNQHGNQGEKMGFELILIHFC